MTKPTRAVVLLLLILAGFPLLAALPGHAAAVRVAGVSLLWWYGGVVAPVLAWLVAVAWLPGRPSARPTPSE